jgi:hypothetical protein
MLRVLIWISDTKPIDSSSSEQAWESSFQTLFFFSSRSPASKYCVHRALLSTPFVRDRDEKKRRKVDLPFARSRSSRATAGIGSIFSVNHVRKCCCSLAAWRTGWALLLL